MTSIPIDTNNHINTDAIGGCNATRTTCTSSVAAAAAAAPSYTGRVTTAQEGNYQYHHEQQQQQQQQKQQQQHQNHADCDFSGGDDWSHVPQVVDARPILPLAAFYMGDLRDGLPMVRNQKQ